MFGEVITGAHNEICTGSLAYFPAFSMGFFHSSSASHSPGDQREMEKYM